jgi:23S rRNA pseudouridine1911/1915/1917 synthase
VTIRQETFEWFVDPAASEERIDKWLAQASELDYSRTQIQKWISEGWLYVNGKAVKSNHRMTTGEKVVLTVPVPESFHLQPEAMALDVVYEDEDVLIVNKPRGLVVHPAPGHGSGTLVNGLLHHCRELSRVNGAFRPGIVHRIDKDTTGLLMVAKNDLAHRRLSEQLKEHSVTRQYYALVHGGVSAAKGKIDAPIGRDPRDRQSMTVTDQHAKDAITHFEVIERLGDYTWMRLWLETGRTHQIRVHMKFIGHPLVGDPKYGPSGTMNLGVEGQALHAGVLGFTHPRSGDRVQFEAPLPQDILLLLERLRML